MSFSCSIYQFFGHRHMTPPKDTRAFVARDTIVEVLNEDDEKGKQVVTKAEVAIMITLISIICGWYLFLFLLGWALRWYLRDQLATPGFHIQIYLNQHRWLRRLRHDWLVLGPSCRYAAYRRRMAQNPCGCGCGMGTGKRRSGDISDVEKASRATKEIKMV